MGTPTSKQVLFKINSTPLNRGKRERQGNEGDTLVPHVLFLTQGWLLLSTGSFFIAKKMFFKKKLKKTLKFNIFLNQNN